MVFSSRVLLTPRSGRRRAIANICHGLQDQPNSPIVVGWPLRKADHGVGVSREGARVIPSLLLIIGGEQGPLGLQQVN
jgi:hypothetical protein